LRGRAGRQGDPGSSRFFISLEDDLISRYGVVGLIPRAHRPARQDGPVEDPVVSREIARAQRIIEGQNFEIRRTLWRYSAMVEEQRAQVCARREELLHDESEPTACAEAAPEHHAALSRTAGDREVARAENRLTMLVLDRRWTDHLRLIEDIREGIHLQRYGGRDPLTEFQRQIIDAYAAMMEELRAEVVDRFRALRAEGGRIDLQRLGVRRPAATWTYLINDNPFASFWVSLIAPGSAGTSMATAVLAVLYWPVAAVVAAWVFVRRALARQKRQE